MTTHERERLELCNKTVSGKHLWQDIYTGSTNHKYTRKEAEMMHVNRVQPYAYVPITSIPICLACGMVNDLTK